jgi:hypothetical protein
VIIGVAIQQTVVASRSLEKEPLVSNYPMYSYTYPSTKVYDEEHRRFVDYRFHRYIPGAISPEVYPWVGGDLLDGPEIPLVKVARREGMILLAVGKHTKHVLPGLIQPEASRGQLLVTTDVMGFEWHRGRFGITEHNAVLGVLRPGKLQFWPLAQMA